MFFPHLILPFLDEKKSLKRYVLPCLLIHLLELSSFQVIYHVACKIFFFFFLVAVETKENSQVELLKFMLFITLSLLAYIINLQIINVLCPLLS